nr:ATP-dependent RNA helicase DDX47 [Paratrimastix eleionoma]
MERGKKTKTSPPTEDLPEEEVEDEVVEDGSDCECDEEEDEKTTKPETTKEAKEEDDEKEETSTPVTPTPTSTDTVHTTWTELGIIPELSEICTEQMHWKEPTNIQKDALPSALQGKDIIGLAQTGSGKTAAFVLPIMQAMLKSPPRKLFAVVIAPTRELALQISDQFQALGASIGLRCATIVGGIDIMQQAIALSRNPHVVVATPGRLVDHLKSTKGFSLKSVHYLVLDEADQLLNLDFQDSLDAILKACPRERITYLYSATMTNKVSKLQRAALRHPVRIEVSSKYSTVDTLIQHYLFVPQKYKNAYLIYVLTELAGQLTMIFTRTCSATQRLTVLLRNLGFAAIPIHGQMSQPARFGALNQFKTRTQNILICTDVASRGLDIPAVDVVINYDLPSSPKTYLHRVGRTARAGLAGRAITIVTQYDVEMFQKIEEHTGAKLPAYEAPKEAVALLFPRVLEAERLASIEMKEQQEACGGRSDRRKTTLTSKLMGEKEGEEEGGSGGGGEKEEASERISGGSEGNDPFEGGRKHGRGGRGGGRGGRGGRGGGRGSKRGRR